MSLRPGGETLGEEIGGGVAYFLREILSPAEA